MPMLLCLVQDVFLVLALITLSALIPAYFLRKPNAPAVVQIQAPAAIPAKMAEAPRPAVGPEAETNDEPGPISAVPRFTSPAYRLLHRRFSQRTPPSDALAPAGRRKIP